MNSPASVVIIGAGAAGGQAVLALRSLGYERTIELIGAEGLAPYERPCLSKEALTQGQAEPTWLVDSAMLSRLDVRCWLDNPVQSLDAQRRRLWLRHGDGISYDRLLIATGAAPRILSIPGSELEGILYLRSFSDARLVHAALARQQALAVIGGGFIGLEVAAAARSRRCAVTVIEAAPQLMGRVVPSEVAEVFVEEHRRQGVRFEMGRRPIRFHGSGALEAIELDDGTLVSASTAVVGIGVSPQVDLALQLGLATADGIVVDTECRTSLANVYAAGDCCRAGTPGTRGTRLEAWQGALDQGDRAAHAMLGIAQPPLASAWVWSNQYDFQLQAAGAPTKVDQIVVRGDVTTGEVLCFQLWKGRLVGAVGVNRSRDMAWVRRALPGTPAVDPSALADDQWSLRQLLPQRAAAPMT